MRFLNISTQLTILHSNTYDLNPHGKFSHRTSVSSNEVMLVFRARPQQSNTVRDVGQHGDEVIERRAVDGIVGNKKTQERIDRARA